MMAKKYKVKMAPMFKKKLGKLPKEEKKVINEIVKELAKNPYKGQPIDAIEIKPMPYEKCDCGKPFFIWRDKNSREVYFNCQNYKCDGFWITEKELKARRKRRAKSG